MQSRKKSLCLRAIDMAYDSFLRMVGHVIPSGRMLDIQCSLNYYIFFFLRKIEIRFKDLLNKPPIPWFYPDKISRISCMSIDESILTTAATQEDHGYVGWRVQRVFIPLLCTISVKYYWIKSALREKDMEQLIRKTINSYQEIFLREL